MLLIHGLKPEGISDRDGLVRLVGHDTSLNNEN